MWTFNQKLSDGDKVLWQNCMREFCVSSQGKLAICTVGARLSVLCFIQIIISHTNKTHRVLLMSYLLLWVLIV